MYCWVIVDPPCSSSPRTMAQAARIMPRMEMPLSVQKVRFSAATMACFMVSGIFSNVSGVRFWMAKLPRRVVPSL
jgi:hypothetical protein